MKSFCLLFVFKLFSLSVASNSSFIDQYLNPSIRPFCTETHEKISFKYGFRARKNKNPNTHVVYLFSTDGKLFSFFQMTSTLGWQNTSVVFKEIFFNEVGIKEETDFWDGKKPNEEYNAAFSDWMFADQSYAYNAAFFAFGDRSRMVNLSLTDHKVTEVHEPVLFNESIWGFTRNKDIEANGFENIFAVDMADSNGFFSPVRVYVKDRKRKGKVISFAFKDRGLNETEEEFERGKRYEYGFDSAAYLSHSRSFNDFKNKINHYLELRTRNGTFSLFDITNNTEYLIVGANEELLGCPPSFCHWREFDDIIRLHDGNQLLVFREWLWNFSGPGIQPKYDEAIIANITSRRHFAANFKTPFKFGIRHVVSASFTDGSTLYIFRNGSFISSESDDIINKSIEAKDFTRIDQFFKGVPFRDYDAILYHKDSRTVHFIEEDKYWAFSMSTMSLTTDSLGQHIENLGLPYDFRVRSVYVEEDNSGKQIKFYLFTKNRYIVFSGTDFNNGRFRPQRHTYYCTSVNFFNCSEELFSCPLLDEEIKPSDENNIWIFILILIVVIIVLVAIIGLLVIFVLKKDRKNNDRANEDKPKNEPKVSNIESKVKAKDKEKPSGMGGMASFADMSTQRSKV